MKRTFRTAVLLSLGLLLSPALHAQKAARAAASSTTDEQKMQRFIDDLMSKMTLEEKIGQLNLITVGFDVTGPVVSKDVDVNIRKGLVGGVFNTYTPVAARKLQDMALKESRLHIPLMFGYDVIHGHRTIFPIPLGLSASWDMTAIERSARVAAEESAADGLHWVFSPMVDIARDPRWGRVAEGAGEDPYLGSQIARAMVRGYQGTDLSKNNTVMACLKHFALYGAAEAGRDYNTTDMSLPRMYNEYLPPYKAAIEAGVGSVMSSFNDINGIPATGNKWLLTDLLRKQWGFKGFVATDYTAIPEMINHGVGNEAQVSAMALNAGADQDMVGEVYLRNLAQNLKDGTVKQEIIDLSCRRILEGKYKLGLFQDPYRGVSEKRAKATLMKKEFLDDARDVARKSFVLLKNDKNALPLKKSGTIALVGPLATRQHDLLGNWSAAGDWKQAVSVEQGIRNVAGSGVKIVTAQGANITDDQLLIDRLNAFSGALNIDKRSSEELIQEAVKVAQGADVVVAVVGESQGMSGEAASRSDISLPGQQLELLKALKKTGKPLVVVLMNGRPLTLNWENQNADAILETWFAGTQGGNAIADVLFGAYNPSGKLTMTFPQSVGQVPLYYNHKSTGRPFNDQPLDKYKSRYLDISNEPLYPFGYGLSYTTFSYSKPELSASTMSLGGTLDVKVTVKNTGNYDGEEVAQLYLRDVAGSVSRPVRELKGFQKVMLKKGESRTLTFHLTTDDLKFYNNDLQWVAEPGAFQVFVGPNSRDTQDASFTLSNGSAAN
ncbi:beta-glucosidase BglX [Hymenobacter cellulosilyticus]|uniref:Periplasmic beta-glucosidase n=1 Tax=Hymenobacter cellulosilyticus TaxID=2932248 RepID=A0A8T9QDD7_9BACT|nr:beta-glucosidase BglX [Hymenobacter cellulosilyticus]UOQ74138.1 beta-glucosidase BglX [Hymenobacter cellulosilyticus]